MAHSQFCLLPKPDSFPDHWCESLFCFFNKKQFKEGRVSFGSELECLAHHGEEAQQQQLDVAGSTVPMVRKQSDECLSSVHFLLFVQPIEWHCPDRGWVFPPQVT